MTQLLEDKLTEVRRLCEQFGVEQLDVFGSATSEAFSDESDIDFVVRFRPLNDPQPGEHFDRYFGLLEGLKALFQREIDLVEENALRNPYFIRQMNATRNSLYAA